MTLKELKDLLNNLPDDNGELDTFNVEISVGGNYETITPEAVYIGGMWNVIIDCDYQPELHNNEN